MGKKYVKSKWKNIMVVYLSYLFFIYTTKYETASFFNIKNIQHQQKKKLILNSFNSQRDLTDVDLKIL